MKICGFFFFFFFLGGGGVISIHYRVFLGQDTKWEYIFGPQIFKYFWVYLIFLIFFFLGGGGGGGGWG